MPNGVGIKNREGLLNEVWATPLVVCCLLFCFLDIFG